MNTATADIVEETSAHGEVFYLSAEFWVAVAFVLVIALLAKPIIKALSSLINNRIQRIKKELAEAEELKLEAQKLYAEYERKFAETDKEIARITAERENAIDENKEKRLRELNNFLQRKQIEVENRIEQEFEQAGAEINSAVGQRTIEILQKVISVKLTKADYNRLIENSISNIKAVSEIK